jgi:hypothetical protein
MAGPLRMPRRPASSAHPVATVQRSAVPPLALAGHRPTPPGCSTSDARPPPRSQGPRRNDARLVASDPALPGRRLRSRNRRSRRPGHHLQRERRVADRPRQRGVVRPRRPEVLVRPVRHPSERRFEAKHAAQRGRNANRAGAVSAVRQRSNAGCHSRRGPSRAASMAGCRQSEKHATTFESFHALERGLHHLDR